MMLWTPPLPSVPDILGVVENALVRGENFGEVKLVEGLARVVDRVKFAIERVSALFEVVDRVKDENGNVRRKGSDEFMDQAMQVIGNFIGRKQGRRWVGV